jgi:hypothetical protein
MRRLLLAGLSLALREAREQEAIAEVRAQFAGDAA